MTSTVHSGRFFDAYADCALWSSTDDDGTPLDSVDAELSTSARLDMASDCEAFLADNADAIERAGLSAAQAGHDFWLTRNRHGAGFWDRGLPQELADELTDAAHAYGSCDLYIGDDGLIYVS